MAKGYFENSDYLAALLSADWFLPYWDSLGLAVDVTKHQAAIAREAKRIVTTFMQGKTSYLQIDLSDERQARTREALSSVFVTEVGPHLDEILGRDREGDPTKLWLLESITLSVTNGIALTAAADDLQLSSSLRSKVMKASESTLARTAPRDFERDWLNAKSAWDVYLRGLFPDQPTWLTDWLLSQSFSPSRFREFWSVFKLGLDDQEVAAARAWYSHQIAYLADRDFDGSLPAWMI